MDEIKEHLPRDLATIAHLLSLYSYPNLKRLVLSSHLYLPNLLKHDSVADLCVENIIRIHESQPGYAMIATEGLPREMHLDAMLEELWAPAPPNIATPLDYAAYYTALRDDGIDVSALPRP